MYIALSLLIISGGLIVAMLAGKYFQTRKGNEAGIGSPLRQKVDGVIHTNALRIKHWILAANTENSTRLFKCMGNCVESWGCHCGDLYIITFGICGV